MESINVLNRRAKIKSRNHMLGKPMPEVVEGAWNEYLKALKKHWPKKPKDDEFSSPAHALYTFRLAVMSLNEET